jgi:hypothetical protein
MLIVGLQDDEEVPGLEEAEPKASESKPKIEEIN